MSCQIVPQCILIVMDQPFRQLFRHTLGNQGIEGIFQTDIWLISNPMHQVF